MTKDNSYTPSCVDCGTQNCKFKDRTYPEFCLTTSLDTEDLEWALERYDEGQNHDAPKWSLKAIAGSPAWKKS